MPFTRSLAAFVSVALVLLLVPVAASTVVAAPTCTNTWVGPSTGFVSLATPSSWSTGLAPAPSDVVCFPSTTAISVQGGAMTVAGWDISPGGSVRLELGIVVTITGEADLGGVTTSGGARLVVGPDTYVDGGETLAVAPGGNITLEPAVAGAQLTIREGGQFTVDNIAISGIDIVNQGTLTVNAADRLGMRPGTSLTNSGTLALNGAAIINAEPGSPVATARNEPGGLVTIDGPAFTPLSAGGIGSAAQFSVIPFANDGTFHVRSGQGALASNEVHGGTFRVDAGAQLGISAPSTVFGPSAVVTGDGFVRVSVFGVGSLTTSVTIDAAATFDVAELHLATGRVAVAGDRSLRVVRVQNGGAFDVRGDIVVDELYEVRPGQAALFAGDGTLTIADGAVMTFGGGNGSRLIESVEVVIDGEIRQAVAGISLENSSRIVNRGEWTMTDNAAVSLGPDAVLRNEGRITIDGSGDTALARGGTLDNVGEIDLRSGRADFRSTAVVQHVAGTLDGGTWRVADGATWLGFPSIRTIDGATVVLRGSGRILRFTGGTQTAFDDLERIGPAGRLELLDGAALDTRPLTVNGLAVDGVLALSGGAAVTTDSLTVDASAEIRVELGAGSPGSFTVTGVADVDGAVVAGQGPAAIVEAIYPFVTSASIVGAFASVTGPGDPPVSVRRVGSTIELVLGDTPPPPPPPPPPPTATLVGGLVDEGSPVAAGVRVVLDEPAGPGGVTITYETFLQDTFLQPAARPGVDFEPVVNGSVTIPEGGFEALLAVPVLDDDVHERPAFRFVRVRVTGGVTVAGDALLRIQDDDPAPTLSLAGDVLAERDEDTVYPLRLTSSGVTDFDRCVSAFVIETGSATIGGDVIAGADGFIGAVTIVAGASSIDVDVTIVGDDVAETGESFDVQIRDGCPTSPGTNVVLATATVDIIDDDAALSGVLVPNLLTLDEGTSGAFTLQLSEVSPVDRLVRMAVFFRDGQPNGVGRDDVEPIADDGWFVIPAGASTVTLPTISARADGVHEGDEITSVGVFDGSTRVAASGGLRIDDIDPRPTIVVVDPSVIDGAATITEGTSSPVRLRSHTVEIELSGPTAVPLGFRLGTLQQGTPGSADVRGPSANDDSIPPGMDILLPRGEVSFVSGSYVVQPGDGRRSITFDVVEDGLAETDEVFVLLFDTARPDEPSSRVRFTILDDDPQLRFEPGPFTDEGTTLPVQLDIVDPADVDRVFDIRLTPSGLTTRDDFVDTSGKVTVPAGATQVELPPVIALADDVYDDNGPFVEYQVFDELDQLVDRQRVTIVNVTPIPTAAVVSTTTFTEGSSGTTRIETITARLNRLSTSDLIYSVVLTGDVVAIPPTRFTFLAGTTEATIQVGIVEDTIPEADQSFTIEAPGTGTRRPFEKATFTIIDDDQEARTLPVITEVRFDNRNRFVGDFAATVELTNATDGPLSLEAMTLTAAPTLSSDGAIGLGLSGSLGAGESRVVSITGPDLSTNVPIRSFWLEADSQNRSTVILPPLGQQFRLRSGLTTNPEPGSTPGSFYQVREGAEMGSHSFDPDTTPPTWGPAPQISVTTTSTRARVAVSYTEPTVADDSDALSLSRQCLPSSGSLFTVGATRTVTCTARDPYGNESSTSFPVVVNRINGQAPGLTPAGQGIPVAGGGFIRNGRVRVVLRSEPVVLAETTADTNGNVSLTVTLPADTTPGSHTITLEGEAPDGTPRLVVYTIEVSRPCTITGTSRSEVIIGTKGDDVICAGGGNDLVFALGGDDIVFGGAGNDIIFGGAGDDYLDGGDGLDIVIGGPGRDTLIGEVRRAR
jgi:hypothetical protein